MKIKYKFALLFAAIFSVSLTGLTYLSNHLFRQDKIAYVYSSMLESSSTAALVLNSELQAQAALFEFIVSNFDFTQGVFPSKNKANLQLSESVQYIRIEGQKDLGFQFLDEIGGLDSENLKILPSLLTSNETSLAFFPGQKNIFGISRVIQLKGIGLNKYRIFVVFKRNPFNQILSQKKYFDLFLVSELGFIAQRAEFSSVKNEKEILKVFFKESKGQFAAQLTKEVAVNSERYMVTWSPLGYSKLGFISILKMDKALAALSKIQRISIAVFLILMGIGLSSVFWMTSRLTENVEKLSESMNRFSLGDLSVRSKVVANDEIGVLSRVFNLMTEKIKKLLDETKEKARMESELETARTVQQQLIPQQEHFQNTVGEILGYYEPASECGGDWWFYFDDGEDFYFIIADVTGHGVPSALITSALRAAVASLAHQDKSDLAKYAAIVNSVIADSAQGTINATCFIGRYRASENVLQYVNASHTTPFIYNLESKDFRYVDEVSGPRLGESKSSVYKSFQIDIGKGELLFAFTDGLSEFQNSQQRMFGERRILKSIQGLSKPEAGIRDYRSQILSDFSNFRETLPLDDDLTFFFFRPH